MDVNAAAPIVPARSRTSSRMLSSSSFRVKRPDFGEAEADMDFTMILYTDFEI